MGRFVVSMGVKWAILYAIGKTAQRMYEESQTA